MKTREALWGTRYVIVRTITERFCFYDLILQVWYFICIHSVVIQFTQLWFE